MTQPTESEPAVKRKRRQVANDFQAMAMVKALGKALKITKREPLPQDSLCVYRDKDTNDASIAATLNLAHADDPRWVPLTPQHVYRRRVANFGPLAPPEQKPAKPAEPVTVLDETIVQLQRRIQNLELRTVTAERTAELNDRWLRFIASQLGLTGEDVTKWEQSKRDAERKRNEDALRQQQAEIKA